MALRKCRVRQSMQRLGISKVFALWADEINSISEASQLLERNLTKMENVPFNENYINWLRRGPNENPKIDKKRQISTQLQHIYIYYHPSKTGWLSKHGFKEYAESLPRQLNIVDSSYDVTDMGQVLLKGSVENSERQAFSIISDDINPFLLTTNQKIFFLYNLLCSEGDFLIPFAYAMFNRFGQTTFSYLEVGNLIPEVIDDILLLFSGLAYTSSDRKQLDDLEKMKISIQKDIQDESEKKGSGARREQECITRLEWMVDLDILKKVASRTYVFTTLGEIVITNLGKRYQEAVKSGYADQAIQKIIDNHFYEIINTSSCFSKAKLLDSSVDFLEFIMSSYDILKGISGYCLFRPLLLLSNIRASNQNQGFFLEYNIGIEKLEKAFRENPERVYYTTDRFGTDVQVKIS